MTKEKVVIKVLKFPYYLNDFIDELIKFQRTIPDKGKQCIIGIIGDENFGYNLKATYSRPYTEEELRLEKETLDKYNDIMKKQRRQQYEALKQEFEGKE